MICFPLGMNMAARLLLCLFSLVPALIAGQKYLRGGSMGSYYRNDLTDDENGDRGGRFVRGYDSKNDEREDDDNDDNTSNEAGSWRGRFARLDTELQMMRAMARLEKRLLAGIAMKRRTQAYVPRWETDEDEMDNVYRISPKAAGNQMRYWEKSCNCWKSIEKHMMRRRGFSISAPMALVSHYIDAAKDQEEMDANKKYLLGLGRK